MTRRILVVAPALDGSSYSRVVQSVFGALARLLRQADWQVEQFGLTHRGQPCDIGWPLWPNLLLGDRYGIEQLPALIAARKFDLVWVFNCYTVLPRYARCFAAMAKRLKVVAYCPLLGTPLQLEGIKALAGFDALVTISPGVQALFESVLQDALRQGELTKLPTMAAIPHGFDQALFYPLSPEMSGTSTPWSNRAALKAAVFADGWGSAEGSFIVLNANRNSPRKHIETTLAGFARFAHDKPPGVRLYLHMAESTQGERLADQAARLGIGTRVRIAGTPGRHPLCSDAELNLLYNACDVGINTASAEGFGMVSLEHAATGAPQIVPGHGVCGEVWRGYGELLAPVGVHRGAPADIIEHQPVDAQSVASALQALYSSHEHYAKLARLARELSQGPALQWSHIARRWHALLEGVLPATRRQ